MSSPIRQIETAIVQRLRAPRAYSGLAVESYGAQLDDETFAWVRHLPAVWVTFDQVLESKRVGKRSFMVTGVFEVLTAQRALVENDRRLNTALDGQDVGLYELLEDNKLLLVNQKLDLEIQPLTPGSIKPVMKGQAGREAVAIYAQSFRTTWLEVIPGEATDAQLLEIGLNYLLKPGDNVPDRTDLVTLDT